MAFARWDPLRDLLAIQQRLDRYAPGPSGWTPPVDLLETADSFVITAELAGLRREDLEISIEEDRVTLSGTRRERPVACEQYHRIERGRGTFKRTFQFATAIDAKRATADLRDGILTVTCPKSSDQTTRRILVS